MENSIWLIFFTFIFNYYLSAFGSSVLGASSAFTSVSATSSAFGASATTADYSLTSSTTSAAGSSVKSSFTSMYLDSILAPTSSFVLAAFPVLFLK